MLKPLNNEHRSMVDLCGIWQFRMDPRGEGESRGWARGVGRTMDIGVPGSWNEQLPNCPGARDYVGDAWYFRTFHVPAEWAERKIWIWFGAVNYRATVFVNGRKVGHHEGGFLPFQFPLESAMRLGKENFLAVKVNNLLSLQTLPPLQPPGKKVVVKPLEHDLHPRASCDFFPYAGIHRQVRLLATPRVHLNDLTVRTDLKGRSGLVEVSLELNRPAQRTARVRLSGFGQSYTREVRLSQGRGKIRFKVPRCRPWGPGQPNLYDLDVEVSRDGRSEDRYGLSVGIRTVKIRGNQLLVNGKPVYLKGFGRHEDFFIAGRGLIYPLVVADFELLDWIHANSFRTSHYPYAEEVYELADRRGILVVDEVAGVGISARVPLGQTLRTHLRQMEELYHRDKNHPSVIVWCVANEAMTWDRKMRPYFKELVSLVRGLDRSRPVTGVICSQPETEQVADLFDILSVNRYFGQSLWVGRLETAEQKLRENLEAFYRRFRKPIFVSEFGAECIAGFHAQPPEIWSEEYQQAVIEMNIRVIRSLPYTIGEHVWNFAEFKTSQELIKSMLNRKGVFTRDRRPKQAAHWLRSFWARPGK